MSTNAFNCFPKEAATGSSTACPPAAAPAPAASFSDAEKQKLTELFRLHGGVLMGFQLHEAGFYSQGKLIEAGLICRRPGRWDTGFQAGEKLNLITF